MRLERRNGYRVLVGGPVPPQAAAITLGNLVVVRKGFENAECLMSHELVHVRQFGELGAARFLVRYVRSYMRARLAGYGHMAAYRRIPLEVEASLHFQTLGARYAEEIFRFETPEVERFERMFRKVGNKTELVARTTRRIRNDRSTAREE